MANNVFNLFQQIISATTQYNKFGWTFEEKSRLKRILENWFEEDEDILDLNLNALSVLLTNQLILGLLPAGRILNIIESLPVAGWDVALIADIPVDAKVDLCDKTRIQPLGKRKAKGCPKKVSTALNL
ncbi:unnamed protein product [Didymodactylos carnosus]|uniref:Uncharacterized protein n=1 Tax=Didymodactylos carnosus TaxID=1234261 RepID=A0A815BVE1_9BILA|nr:unnamed protein product [Didymodactylos carnosus]CAF1275128.1 unnamed protein product [Didymodactylos carnosus]CAF3843545.1 unnamed protein product [Didymodactylos carnosus]CAF4065932.1 unnamed protein product [Didymodactylos carnosus]